MGTPAFAAVSLSALITAGHRIVGVITRPDASSGRGLKPRPSPVKQVALSHGLTLMQPTRIKGPDLPRDVAALGADLTVVAAYGRILTRPLLEAAPLGAVNVHASLLPRWRGAAPIARAIAAGDETTGVTIMRMVERLDAGDILARVSTPIGPEETAGQLEGRLAHLGAALLVETIERLAAGTAAATPQDETAATYAPMLSKEDGRIDWVLSSVDIARRVRAFDPWPVAWTTTPRGTRLRVRRAATVAEDPGAAPGTVVVGARGDQDPDHHTGAGVMVACGEGTALRLIEVQPEGRRSMTAQEAVSGRHFAAGDRLGGA